VVARWEERVFVSFDGGRVLLSIQRTVNAVHLVGLDTVGVGTVVQSRGMFVNPNLNSNQSHCTPALVWAGSIFC